MKDFIKYFLVAFIPFLIYGFYNGYGQRAAVIKSKLYQDMRLEADDGKFYFRHYCNGAPTYDFDTDSDTFTRSLAAGGRLASTHLEDAPSERHLEYKELVTAFLGGGTATALFTFKDFEKITAQKSSIVKIIATLVGGVSGYLLGKWLGSNYRTDCDSPLALAILENDKEWLNVEQTYMLFSLLGLKWRGRPLLFGENSKNMNPLGEDPLFEINSPLKQEFGYLKEKCERKSENFSSQDFARLCKLKAVYSEITNRDLYKTLLFHHERKVLKGVTLQKPTGYFTFSQQQWDSSAVAASSAIDSLYNHTF